MKMHSGEEVDDSLGIGYPPQLEGTDLPKNMKYENAQWEEVDDSYWIGYRPQLADKLPQKPVAASLKQPPVHRPPHCHFVQVDPTRTYRPQNHPTKFLDSKKKVS